MYKILVNITVSFYSTIMELALWLYAGVADLDLDVDFESFFFSIYETNARKSFFLTIGSSVEPALWSYVSVFDVHIGVSMSVSMFLMMVDIYLTLQNTPKP